MCLRRAQGRAGANALTSWSTRGCARGARADCGRTPRGPRAVGGFRPSPFSAVSHLHRMSKQPPALPPSHPPIQTTNQKHVDADCSMSFQFSFQNWLHQGRVLSTHSPAPTKWRCGRLGVDAGLARSKHGLPLSNSSWQSSSVQGKLYPGTLWKFS